MLLTVKTNQFFNNRYKFYSKNIINVHIYWITNFKCLSEHQQNQEDGVKNQQETLDVL